MEVRDDTIYFAKLKKDAIIPSKDIENGGYDIYANFDDEYIQILPHETKMISTGISSAFSDSFAMILKERGSTGTKGIAQRCGVIDSGFRGEWKVPITNTTDKPLLIIKKEYLNEIKQNFAIITIDNYIFYPYEKAICQALLLPIPKVNIKEVSYNELQLISSKRGNGMLGSSGK